MAVILVLGVKVPFTTGGQEVLVGSLVKELRARGHDADVIELPDNPASHSDHLFYASLWRTIDFSSFFGKKVDLIIATKFPSYYARHPRKSLWLVHQHRAIYDLFGSRFSDFSDDPRDEAVRRMLSDGDRRAIAECSFISGISRNVMTRLQEYNGVPGEALYPPLPLGTRYRCDDPQPYILSVGRICTIKRVDLMVKALPGVHEHITLKIVGRPDEAGVMEYLTNEIKKHHLTHRVEFLGRVDDNELLDLYAHALGVYYAPFDEDYGYVTLEALASGKPVITASDSGGVLEFVHDGENGYVVSPDTTSIAHACNRLVDDPLRYRAMSTHARECIDAWGVTTTGWDHVVSRLLSPLSECDDAQWENENEQSTHRVV
jgi:glycosyltransferase involved in cell wall biosynthesis